MGGGMIEEGFAIDIEMGLFAMKREQVEKALRPFEEAKIEARRTGQPLADGAITTACAQACPAQAIVFGDLNDPKSRVSMLSAGHRSYDVLDELNTRPSVHYLKIVRQGSTPGGRRG